MLPIALPGVISSPRHGKLGAVKNCGIYKEVDFCHKKGKCRGAPVRQAANIPLSSLEHTSLSSDCTDQPPMKKLFFFGKDGETKMAAVEIGGAMGRAECNQRRLTRESRKYRLLF